MAATIHDVAQLAGVAISTVSKVMNDSPRISEQTRARVREAMRQLDYHPSRHARGLARNRSDSIGVLMGLGRHHAFHNPYRFEILSGIEQSCTQQQHSVTLLNTQWLAQDRKAVSQLVAERKVDAVILHADEQAPFFIRQFTQLKLPFVVIGRGAPGEGHSWVDMDNRHAGLLATRHLLAQGYRRLQFIGNHPADGISLQREQGFTQALAEAGLAPQTPALFAQAGEVAEGAALWQQIVQQPQRPDALLVAGNPLAAGLLAAARSQGIAIGPELGLVSFDNYPYAQLTDPPLSVLDIDLFALGQRAAHEVFLQLANPGHRSQIMLLDMALQARASSRR
ncbi:LacI family DNA-binding transcriptional regulator [Pseudaeromonas paramecii]|uniref:LacI family DNA-binding transcriptional regulator n=1 Tax=Pseudaeromonas paramecii TaxID=2138166 RepID=A0ABP8QE79_9GAMM